MEMSAFAPPGRGGIFGDFVTFDFFFTWGITGPAAEAAFGGRRRGRRSRPMRTLAILIGSADSLMLAWQSSGKGGNPQRNPYRHSRSCARFLNKRILFGANNPHSILIVS